MSHITKDLIEAYNTYFPKTYKIGEQWQDKGSDNREFTDSVTRQGIHVRKLTSTGVEVYLPVELVCNDTTITIDCATVRVTYKNTIIRTPVSERRGAVKEQYNGGDYVFTIKGVLIGKDRKMPDTEIWEMKQMATNYSPVYLNNALAELFMDGDNRIAIESLEFPETEGKHIRFRPFVMVCETDLIETLEVKQNVLNDQ